jgi:proteasome assembly chaperone (PAC2) family protein
VTLYRLDETPALTEPVLVSAFDGWVDAGSAATTAADRLAEGGSVVATFDGDVLFDYRARRPTLDIVDGRLTELTWPQVRLHRARIETRDLLILTGAEPDFRWTAFSAAVIELARRLGVTQSISLGAIPAAVPHTRAVPIMGTASEPGLLRGSVQPGPAGHLRVPAAAISVLEMAIAEAGIPTVGYFAQVPHYVSGPYPVAALALLQALERHLEVDIPSLPLTEEASQMRANLDAAAAADTSTKAYVERLEAMVDEQRLPAGDELISEIERFLRARGPGGPSGPGETGGLQN